MPLLTLTQWFLHERPTATFVSYKSDLEAAMVWMSVLATPIDLGLTQKAA